MSCASPLSFVESRHHARKAACACGRQLSDAVATRLPTWCRAPRHPRHPHRPPPHQTAQGIRFQWVQTILIDWLIDIELLWRQPLYRVYAGGRLSMQCCSAIAGCAMACSVHQTPTTSDSPRQRHPPRPRHRRRRRRQRQPPHTPPRRPPRRHRPPAERDPISMWMLPTGFPPHSQECHNAQRLTPATACLLAAAGCCRRSHVPHQLLSMPLRQM
jgi:hypothetical protein